MFLIAENGIISNIIVANSDFAAKFGALPFYEGAKIGKVYDPPTLEKQVSVLETENRLLKAQVQALADRNESMEGFMEACVAEMLLDLETRTSLLEMGVK